MVQICIPEMEVYKPNTLSDGNDKHDKHVENLQLNKSKR